MTSSAAAAPLPRSPAVGTGGTVASVGRKARILLMLALRETRDRDELRRMFETC